jgi:hypothetical protein
MKTPLVPAQIVSSATTSARAKPRRRRLDAPAARSRALMDENGIALDGALKTVATLSKSRRTEPVGVSGIPRSHCQGYGGGLIEPGELE